MANQFQEPLTTSPIPGLTKQEQRQLSEETVSLQAERTVYNLTFPMVLKAALELGVIDTIAALEEDEWLSPSEIASRLPAKPTNPEAPMLLDRMMRLLTSHSILKFRVDETAAKDPTGKAQRVYAAEPICKFFLKDSEVSGSLLSFFMLCQNHVVFKALSHLKDVILEGKDVFVSAYGKQVFEYIDSDERFASMFSQGMSESSTMVMNKILEVFKGFENVNTLVDVGGGHGAVLGLITSKYPHIRGINFDLASALINAPTYPGVHHVAGDMFVEIPRGDVIFVKWILQAWSDENCVKILQNCWRSLPEKGKVIIVDAILPMEPKSEDMILPMEPKSEDMVLTMDMFILSQPLEGIERSLQKFEALARASGFLRCDFVCHSYSFSVIEFHK